MSDDRFIDPRLQAKEALFQKIHVEGFAILAHISAIQSIVENTGCDIPSDNEDFIALQSRFTTVLEGCHDVPTELKTLINQTSEALESEDIAYATKAQLCTMGLHTLQHWLILSDIPEDLRDVDEVTASIKEKLMMHLSMWHKFFFDSGLAH